MFLEVAVTQRGSLHNRGLSYLFLSLCPSLVFKGWLWCFLAWLLQTYSSQGTVLCLLSNIIIFLNIFSSPAFSLLLRWRADVIKITPKAHGGSALSSRCTDSAPLAPSSANPSPFCNWLLLFFLLLLLLMQFSVITSLSSSIFPALDGWGFLVLVPSHVHNCWFLLCWLSFLVTKSNTSVT